jgi:hypothetical protein
VKNVQPAQYIPEHHPPIVWVTYTDNSFVPVSGPKIVGDTSSERGRAFRSQSRFL